MRKVFMYPCGCVELDAKGSGELDVNCGRADCYRLRRRPTVQLNRAARRARR